MTPTSTLPCGLHGSVAQIVANAHIRAHLICHIPPPPRFQPWQHLVLQRYPEVATMILRLHTPLLRTCFNFCLPEPYQVAARRSFFVRESCGLNRFCSLYLTVPSAVQSTLCSLKNVSDIVLARPKASVLDVSCVPTSLVHAFKNYAIPLLCTFAASSEAQSYLVGG